MLWQVLISSHFLIRVFARTEVRKVRGGRLESLHFHPPSNWAQVVKEASQFMTQRISNDGLPEFVSTQVSEARRFFLNLNHSQQHDLLVVCGGVERMRPEYEVNSQDFPYYAVEFVAEGEGVLNISGNEYQLSAGSVFAYGPRVPHTIRNVTNKGMRKYYVDFIGKDSLRLLIEAGVLGDSVGYTAVGVASLRDLTEIFEMLIRDASANGPMVSEISESLLKLLLIKIAQHRLPEGSSMPRAYATFERTCRYIDQHFLKLHTARDIAADCGITAIYLSRLFGRFSECGAYQYLQHKKMNYAAGLLMNEGLLVKDVAARLTFSDQFQFSRAFKRVYGIAPTHLMQSGTSGQPQQNPRRGDSV